MRKAIILLACILWAACACAQDSNSPFEVWIELYLDGDYYYRPAMSEIKMTPMMRIKPLRVVVKNISNDTQKLIIDSKQGSLDFISFEITDENNNSNLITKKVDTSKSKVPAYTYIAPGKNRFFEVYLSPAEWENVGALVNKGSRKLHARAVYKSGSRNFCSTYYDFVVE
jgi:hypothetical protein